MDGTSLAAKYRDPTSTNQPVRLVAGTRLDPVFQPAAREGLSCATRSVPLWASPPVTRQSIAGARPAWLVTVPLPSPPPVTLSRNDDAVVRWNTARTDLF